MSAISGLDGLRIGVEYSDGGRAELGTGPYQLSLGDPDPPLLNRLQTQGGVDFGLANVWMWPLPPPGAITFAVNWEAQGVHDAKHTSGILEASQRAELLWPAEP